MKEFENLTDEEIMELSDQDIERLIDYRCAKKGIPFLWKKPTEPTGLDVLDKDAEIYKLSVDYLFFLDIAEAQAVLELLLKSKIVKVEYQGTVYKEIDNWSTPRIQKQSIYSPEHYAKATNEHRDLNEVKKRYDKDLAGWNTTKESRVEVIDEVLGKIEEVDVLRDKKGRFKEDFKKYVKMAKGDKEEAFKFLIKAYPEADDKNFKYYLLKEAKGEIKV